MNKIILNHPEELYHSGDELSSGGLKMLLDDPYKFWYFYINPDGKKRRTKAMDFGSAAHCLLFQPEEFANKFEVVEPRVRYNGDKTCIRQPDYDEINDMVAVLRKDDEIKKFIINGLAEVSCFIDIDGKPHRARFDYIKLLKKGDTTTAIIVDYKTIGSISNAKIHSNKLEFGYDIQQKHYLNCLNEAMRLYKAGELVIEGGTEAQQEKMKKILLADNAEFAFLYQDKNPPYLPCVKLLDEHITSNTQVYINAAVDIYNYYNSRHGVSEWPSLLPKISVVAIEDFGSKYDWIHQQRLTAHEIIEAKIIAENQKTNLPEELI